MFDPAEFLLVYEALDFGKLGYISGPEGVSALRSLCVSKRQEESVNLLNINEKLTKYDGYFATFVVSCRDDFVTLCKSRLT